MCLTKPYDLILLVFVQKWFWSWYMVAYMYTDPVNCKVTDNNERGWKCRLRFFILSFTTQISNVRFLVSLLFRRPPSPNTHPHAPYTVGFVAKNRGLSAGYWTCWGRCLAFTISNDAVLSSNIFTKCHSKYFYCMSFIHSFICLRGIASCIKVRIQSALNYDYVIFLWKWNWNMNILRQRKKSSFHVQRLICQKNPPKNPTVTVFLVFSLFKLCLICRLNFYKIFQLVYKNLRYSLVYLCILLILLLSHMLVYWKITCLLVIVCPFIAVNQSLHALIISSLQLSIINITQTTENFFAKFKGRWEIEIQD